MNRMYSIRPVFRNALLGSLGGLTVWRAFRIWADLSAGLADALLAFPLTVIFPALLVALLVRIPETKSREGILMRVGTMIQLTLIIALPSVALYLALGLPVVFLIVELFETRLPRALREPLVRIAVR